MAQSLAPLQSEMETLKAGLAAAKNVPAKEPKDIRELLEEATGDAGDDDKYERLSNKQLVDIVCSAVDTALSSQADVIKSSLVSAAKPDSEKVANLERLTMQIVARLGLSEARKQFPDFDNHKEDITKILSVYPGMDFQDAYLLAKSKAASTVAPRGFVDTEKPGSGPTPSPSRGDMPMGDDAFAIMAGRGRAARSGDTNKSGLSGFRSIVDAAIDKTLSNR